MNGNEIVSYFKSILNIDGKKSETVEFPEIPVEFRLDFIRGLWDTDGHIGAQNGRGFLGMKAPVLIASVARELERLTNLTKNDYEIRKSGVKTELRFNSRDVSVRVLEQVFYCSECNE